MPDFLSVTIWKGVSYIGNRARMSRILVPLVQSPSPFQAWSATPMVVMPSSISLPCRRRMFWFGPCVCCVLIGSPIFSPTREAQACP
jgi:hypothetical protein